MMEMLEMLERVYAYTVLYRAGPQHVSVVKDLTTIHETDTPAPTPVHQYPLPSHHVGHTVLMYSVTSHDDSIA